VSAKRLLLNLVKDLRGVRLNSHSKGLKRITLVLKDIMVSSVVEVYEITCESLRFEEN